MKQDGVAVMNMANRKKSWSSMSTAPPSAKRLHIAIVRGLFVLVQQLQLFY